MFNIRDSQGYTLLSMTTCSMCFESCYYIDWSKDQNLHLHLGCMMTGFALGTDGNIVQNAHLVQTACRYQLCCKNQLNCSVSVPKICYKLYRCQSCANSTFMLNLIISCLKHFTVYHMCLESLKYIVLCLRVFLFSFLSC